DALQHEELGRAPNLRRPMKCLSPSTTERVQLKQSRSIRQTSYALGYGNGRVHSPNKIGAEYDLREIVEYIVRDNLEAGWALALRPKRQQDPCEACKPDRIPSLQKTRYRNSGRCAGAPFSWT